MGALDEHLFQQKNALPGGCARDALGELASHLSNESGGSIDEIEWR